MVNLQLTVENSLFNMEFPRLNMVNSRTVFALKINDGIFSAKYGKLTVKNGKFTESYPQLKKYTHR